MSRLPLENRNVFGIRGPDYTPKYLCAHPFCQIVAPLEKHHLWPRSFLRHQPQNWVKLPDGTETGNLVYLCREHHQQITENKARIVWTVGAFAWQGFDGEHAHITEHPLDPQPPRAVDDWPEEGVNEVDDDAGEWMVWNTGPRAVHTHEEPVPEGSECPTCLRRVPKKKKDTTPTTKVVSFRIPLDNASDFEEIIEAAAKHLGVYEDSFWKYGVILKSLVLALQEPGHEAG